MDPTDTLTDLERRAEQGGGEERMRRQHEAGEAPTCSAKAAWLRLASA